ncbi:MAG: 2-isopropylmalate synthase [Candidatus Angelobacter sp.]|jgi:2-isopropylmalate synthase|nr:2-isopropylmalate synthase [Candidatus Angelobacter sp.]
MEKPRITFFDTTLRDGEQAPGCSMGVYDKLRMARQLDDLGVDVMEAGFPIASDDDFRAVRLIATELSRPIIAGLARASEPDISRAWAALETAQRPRIHVFLASSDLHLQCKLKITREQALEQVDHAVAFAKSLCADVEFSPEDATRSDLDFLCRVVQTAVDAGATTINIPDTVGYAVPDEFAGIIRTVRERVLGIENVTISVHCHNDLGLAVANTIAAINAGARQVECTVNGIGERAGNASLEEIAMVLSVRQAQLPYEIGINTQRIYPTSCLLSEIVGFAPQPNKAIVGRNAFAHEAGIHQHGVIANPLCYEIMTPESVGVQGNNLVLGKHSGRHALSKRLAELGCPASGSELDSVYTRFMKLAESKKKIYDQDLLSLVPVATRQRASAHAVS